MKNIILSLFVLAAGLVCSCSDLLVEKPQSIAVESFYNTNSEIEAGVAAIYAPLRSGDIFGVIYTLVLESSSDFFEGRASWATLSLYQGLDNTNQSRTGNAWRQLYSAVRNANIMIEAIPKAKSVSDNDKDKYLGETRFLRALAYFQLVRNWGAIALRTEENKFEYNLPRTPVAEVYQLIVSDLEFAEAALPSTATITGHPTKWSAKTLLADVYFYLNQYSKAAEKSNEVIQSRQYSLVEVTVPDDFEKLYGASVVNSTEEIFYFKYHTQDMWLFPVYIHGFEIPHIIFPGGGFLAIYNNENYPVYVNWDDDDLRKTYNWYPFEFSAVAKGMLLLKKFNDRESTSPRNSYPLYRYADCLLMYAEASCHVSGGPTAAGLEALNMVHRRAYGYPATQPSPVDFRLSDYNKESFIDLCMKERGYETVGEGKRWLDLKRAGKAMAEKIVRENKGREIAEKHYLWPIPVSETNYNDAITDQNPGY